MLGCDNIYFKCIQRKFKASMSQPPANRGHEPSSPPNPQTDRNWRKPGIIAVLIGLIVVIVLALSSLNRQPATPQPTETQQAAIASETPSDQATSTPEPSITPTQFSTDTPIPPSETASATQTDVPPTEAPTNTSHPSVATVTQSGEGLTLTIFRDNDSFTLYVPQSDQSYSLEDLSFSIIDSQGSQRDLLLSDFLSFRGMPFADITSLNKVICFRIYRQSAIVPAPLDCANGSELLLTQGLADADVFWYDRVTGQARTVMVLQDGMVFGICAAGQSTCEMDIARIIIDPLSETPTALSSVASATLGYPCKANVIFTGGGLLNQVRLTPNRNAQFVDPVNQGAEIIITMHQYSDQTDWYKITYQTSQTGWIPIEFISASSDCPST